VNNLEFTLKVPGVATIRQIIYHLLLVVCSNNDSIMYHFWHITSFTVYVTACDLE